MWEGALFEYLKSIGHPFSNMFLDPKETVLKVWAEGGMVGTGDFVPSFVAREVKRRYEWVVSPDLEEKLADLRLQQEKVKRAEVEMLTGHDFTYVLNYLKKMNNLRGTENGFREYACGQLEIARSRLDSQAESQRMMREDQLELEEKLMSLTGRVSDQLAASETMAETYMNLHLDAEADLQRLTEIMESYIESEEDRAESGGGTAQASSMRHPDLSRGSVRQLHRKMQEYRNMRDEHDEELRERARGHVSEVDRLEAHIKELEYKLEYSTRDLLANTARAEEAEEDVRFCAKKMMKMALAKHCSAQESWAFGLRNALQVADYQRKFKDIKALMTVALLEPDNELVVKLARGLNDVCSLLSAEELRELEESLAMAKVDAFSARLRKFHKEKEAANRSAKKPKKTVASASGKGKEGGEGGKDDESKASKDSKATKGSKKSGKKDKKGDGDGEKEKKKKKKK